MWTTCRRRDVVIGQCQLRRLLPACYISQSVSQSLGLSARRRSITPGVQRHRTSNSQSGLVWVVSSAGGRGVRGTASKGSDCGRLQERHGLVGAEETTAAVMMCSRLRRTWGAKITGRAGKMSAVSSAQLAGLKLTVSHGQSVGRAVSLLGSHATARQHIPWTTDRQRATVRYCGRSAWSLLWDDMVVFRRNDTA